MSETNSIAEGKGEYAAHALAPPTEEQKKMDRKILLKTDLCVLTILVLVATIEFLDKNGLAYAAVWGLRADTHLVGQEYSWISSIFYFGYLAALFPCMYLVTVLPIGKLVGASTTLWGITLLCMAACHNFAGLAAVRFFLGVFEASILPCFMIISSMWWKRSEQALRTAAWYNTLAGIFGGILSYAIGHLKGPLPVWKYIFLIYGSVTVILGIVVIVLLPDSPETAWFLNAKEKDRVLIRLAENQQGKKTKEFKLPHIFEAIKDARFWTIILFCIAQSIINAGVTNFNPLIIAGFGFSQSKTTLMATPQAAVALVAQTVLSIVALYFKNVRCYLWMFSCLPALIGAVLIRVLDHTTQRAASLVGVYLMGFYNVSWVLVLSLATSNNSGTTKKAFVSVAIAIAYSVGNIVGTQFFRTSQAPTYPLGIFAMMVCFAIMFLCGLLYLLLVLRENRRRDELYGEGSGEVTEEVVNAGKDQDWTDGELTSFRYSY